MFMALGLAAAMTSSLLVPDRLVLASARAQP